MANTNKFKWINDGYWDNYFNCYRQFNLFCYRTLSQYKKYKQLFDIIDDYIDDGYKIKQLSRKDFINYHNNWINERTPKIFSEMRNWKRNSKRKHQWKTKNN